MTRNDLSSTELAALLSELVTTPQAAELVGVARNTIPNWEQTRGLAPVGTIGKKIKVYWRDDVIAASDRITSPSLDGQVASRESVA